MTPPQKKVHHGRVKMTADQAYALVEGLRLVNAPAAAEIEIRMGFERKMEVKVTTHDGIALAELSCRPNNGIEVTPLAPTA